MKGNGILFREQSFVKLTKHRSFSRSHLLRALVYVSFQLLMCGPRKSMLLRERHFSMDFENTVSCATLSETVPLLEK